MLLLPQKKKITSIVMSKLSRPESKETPFIDRGDTSLMEGSLAMPEEDDSAALDSCALAILRAIERKSPRDLVNALQDFFMMVDDDSDEAEEGAEGDPLYSAPSDEY